MKTKKTNSWERIFIWLDKIIYLYTAGETLEAKKEEKTFRKYLEVNFIPKEEIKKLIIEEINIANKEEQPTSRLTSLFNKIK